MPKSGGVISLQLFLPVLENLITMCYIYDEDVGDPTQDVPPGTPFSRLPEGWVCPDCGLGVEEFFDIPE